MWIILFEKQNVKRGRIYQTEKSNILTLFASSLTLPHQRYAHWLPSCSQSYVSLCVIESKTVCVTGTISMPAPVLSFILQLSLFTSCQCCISGRTPGSLRGFFLYPTIKQHSSSCSFSLFSMFIQIVLFRCFNNRRASGEKTRVADN